MGFLRFLRDTQGGIAPLVGMAAIPLVGAVGAAVDLGRASSVRAAMQAAGDATALIVAKSAASLSSDQIQQQASSLFMANFKRTDAQNVVVTATSGQTPAGFSVTVNGSATVSTTIVSIFGFSQIPINTTGTVTWSNSKLRVALVLDNTGSMSQSGKMTALKNASHNLLKQLQQAAVNNGDVYVSIIPFSKDVDAGAANYNASWIDWTDWDAANGTCSKHTYADKTTCISHGKSWTPKAHSAWNGCVTDRTQNYDTVNMAPSTGANFPAEQYSYCPSQVLGLTYDWTALNNAIDAMTPNGNTNQAIGLVWGWQSLSNVPFTVPAMDVNYQYKQIIILLTDGLNTQDRWYITQSAIDNRQSIACNNIKAAGVIVYTVQVNTDGSPTSTLLHQCVTDTNKFFLLTSADQIVSTFQSIGTKLVQLHISK